MLRIGQGAPAAPQLHASGPSHGLFWRSSQTHMQPSQRRLTMRRGSIIIDIRGASCFNSPIQIKGWSQAIGK
jgi:hypothetical protein